jgi:uncharacterized protein (DUF427 family)
MGLAWQQGPLARRTIGHFLVPQPLPEHLLFAEPLRRRMRVQFGNRWIVDSEDIVLLHEPGHYPVAYFPLDAIEAEALEPMNHQTTHRDLGSTAWYTVWSGEQRAERAAWQHIDLPAYAKTLDGRVAFAWRPMDAFYEEDERIVGHAADSYHRIDIRQTSRHLVVRQGERVIADTVRARALYESGFAPRWYVPRDDVDETALTPAEGQTFCPYKGICSYYDIGDAHQAAWSYERAFEEVTRISNYLSFEPDKVVIDLDGRQLMLEPGQDVISHGVDRNLTVEETTLRVKP